MFLFCRRYLPQLLSLFRQCEDVEDRESLSHLYSIMKSIIMMNDMQLIDDLMQENAFWDVVGCLEYDPELGSKKANHRHFLKVILLYLLSIVFRLVYPLGMSWCCCLKYGPELGSKKAKHRHFLKVCRPLTSAYLVVHSIVLVIAW